MWSRLKNFFKKMLLKLLNSVKRFPETIILTLGLVITVLLLNHNAFDNDDALTNVLLVFMLGMPLSATLVLICERLSLSLKTRGLLDSIVGIFLVGYYVIIPKPITQQFLLYSVSLIIIFYLAFTLVPYFYKRSLYSVYCIKLMTSFFITYLYTFVLFVGIVAIIFTVDQLFNLNIDENIYADLFIITTGLFGVTYYLGSVPRMELVVTFEDYPKIVRVLYLTIIMPLLTAYSIILYAYFAKILINQKWPEGLVGNLVLWYGWISMFILFCIFELGEKNSWPGFFRRIFPFTFIIPLGMLFSTIWIRTDSYGLTMARYYVWLSGIWFLANVIYYIINKWRYPSFITASLVIFILIGAFGPFSSYNTSIASQSKRLENVLTELNMLKENKIIKRADLSDVEKEKINSILFYLDNLEALDKIEYLPDGFAVDQTEEILGYSYNYEYGEAFFNYYYENGNIIANTSDYEYMASFYSVHDGMSVDINNDDMHITINEEGLLTITYKDSVIASESMSKIIFDLHQKLNNKPIESQDELTSTIEGPTAIIKIEWSNLYGKIISGNSAKIDSMTGRIWINLY